MKRNLVILIAFILCFMGGCQQRQEEQTELPSYAPQENEPSKENKVPENEGAKSEIPENGEMNSPSNENQNENQNQNQNQEENQNQNKGENQDQSQNQDENQDQSQNKGENQNQNRGENQNQNQDEDQNQEEDIMVEIIQDVYTDKARYDIGESVEAYIELQPVSQSDMTLEILVRHLADEVYRSVIEVPASEEKSVHTVQISMPEEDFKGYSLEVYVKQGDRVADCEMSAIEVASDWSRFPRYAYLTQYGKQTEEEIKETLLRLNKHHITGLFYYDVLYRHEKPAAGSPGEEGKDWHTLANSYASFETVSKLIDYGHKYHMNSYLYNLIFGAYADYEKSGVKAEWGLYRDAAHQQQDYHGDFADSWATKRLYLFNPANPEWQDYYLDVTKQALSIFGYDGLQVDSLGGRGLLYDYNGTAVDLKTTYPLLLNRLTDELGCRVIFNPVSGYGMREVLRDTDYDIIYEEVWPGDAFSYGALKAEVDHLRGLTKDEKGIVLSAYMNYQKKSGVFNKPGILLTDAVLMASGAAHLEIGDTGMLKNEYYPGDTLRIKEDLEFALRNYYSFSVAYENYLRDASWKEILLRTYINGKAAALDAKANAIWSFTKANHAGEQVIHFINLNGVDSLEWVDNHGEQKEPVTQKNLTVVQHLSIAPKHIYLASPDQREGILSELDFEMGEDSEGIYVRFVMPQLNYWNMVIIK